MSANLGNKTSAADWIDIAKMYILFSSHDNNHRPLLDLVRWLFQSEYIDMIVPNISHATLNLQLSGKYCEYCPVSLVRVSCYRDDYLIATFRRELDGGYSIWERSYGSEQLRPALEAWLARARMEWQITRN